MMLQMILPMTMLQIMMLQIMILQIDVANNVSITITRPLPPWGHIQPYWG
jgi:hypothetical protein